MSLNGPVNDSLPDPDRPDSSEGLILVVDDNPHILRLMVSLLGMRGLRAGAASSLEEAMLVCQSQGGAISVAIVDRSLCSGDRIGRLADLKKLVPHLKIILTSGMLEEDCYQDEEDLPYDFFLQKPFTPADLMKTLQRVSPAKRT